MTDRDAQFLALYQACRCADQQAFYQRRLQEFDRAQAQVIYVTGSLLGLSTVVAVLASANFGGQRTLWGVLAVAIPALSTALAAYQGLYAFDRHVKLYRDASAALIMATADAPDASSADAGAIQTYVGQVESILRKEQGQWGQLAREIKLIEPPGTPGAGKQ